MDAVAQGIVVGKACRTAIVLTATILLDTQEVRAQPRWLVDAKPILDIAGLSPTGDVVFTLATGATRLPNGTIVVADGLEPAVRFFDATGKLTRTVGRKGDGPGEFQVIQWLGRCGGDSVFVKDFWRPRITVISADGAVVREFLSAENGWTCCSPRGALAVLGPLNPRSPAPGAKSERQRARLSLLNARGEVTHAFGELPFADWAAAPNGDFLPRPLGRVTSFAMSSDRLYVGTADSAFVDAHSLDGKRRETLSLRTSPRAPSRANAERFADWFVRYQPGPLGGRMRQLLLEFPLPDRLPPYYALFTDPSDALWVQLSFPGDPDTRLRVLSPDGRVLADVSVPRDLTIFEIGPDYILGGYSDASDEPHVALFRLHRG